MAKTTLFGRTGHVVVVDDHEMVRGYRACLGLEDEAGLTRYAVEHGLLPLQPGSASGKPRLQKQL